MVDESSVLYTCINATSIAAIDALPDTVIQTYSIDGNPLSFTCVGDMKVEPLGFSQSLSIGTYTYDNGESGDFFGGYKNKFGRMNPGRFLLFQDKLAAFFGHQCVPAKNTCPTGFGKEAAGLIRLEERHDRKVGACREDFVFHAVRVHQVFSRCLINGRDMAENEHDSRKINYGVEQNCGNLGLTKVICSSRSHCQRSNLFLRWRSDIVQPQSIKKYTKYKRLKDSGLESMTCAGNLLPKVVDFVHAPVLANGTVDEAKKQDALKNREPRCCESTESCVRSIRCDDSRARAVKYPCPGTSFRLTYECVCPKGFLPHQDQNGSCTPCLEGTYRNGILMDHCEACVPGSFADGKGMTSCRLTPTGTFVDKEQQVGYKFCPKGTTTTEIGASSIDDCVPCSEGTISVRSLDTQTCKACQDNFWPNPSKTECLPYRELGSYTANGRIIPCAPGSFRYDPGQSTCTLCPRGSYSRSSGASSCQACGMGMYADEEGLTACKLCPEGTSTVGFGAEDVLECTKRPTVDYTAPEFRDLTCQQLLAYQDPAEPAELHPLNLTLRELMLGNGLCNPGPWNTPQSGYDGGDCCRASCVVSDPVDDEDTFESDFACTHSTFHCLDPKNQPPLEITQTSPGKSKWWKDEEEICRSVPDPDSMTWAPEYIERVRGDGVCDVALNKPEYSFDGGDCCISSCIKNPMFPFQSCLSDCHCREEE